MQIHCPRKKIIKYITNDLDISPDDSDQEKSEKKD